jgi:tRNA-dependent cyclodipeptide synthase
MAIRIKIFPASARSHIQTSRAYLSVSPSNRLTATEAHLREIFQWMQRGVGPFDVLVGDYFHRHNIEDLEGLQPSEALQVATQQGDAHARQIQFVLDQVDLTAVKIRRTSTISRQPGFFPALREMETAYHSNTTFARLIDQGTDAFLRRFAPERTAVEAARLHSRLYQLEELAVFALLANEGFSTNVYAGAHLPVMKALVSGGVDGIAPALRSAQLVELRPHSKSRTRSPPR